MALLAHLLGIFTWFIGALIIWLLKKDQSRFVDHHGKEALNFQITLGIAYIAVGVLTCLTLGVGSLLSPIVWFVNVIFCILACVAANNGQWYRYTGFAAADQVSREARQYAWLCMHGCCCAENSCAALLRK